MSNHNAYEVAVNGRPSASELQALSAQLDASTQGARAPKISNFVNNGATEVVTAGGQTRTVNHGKPQASATSATPAGMVDIPGLGRTSIKAAVAAGILPEGWQPQGASGPFDGAPTSGGAKGLPSQGPAAAAGADAGGDEDNSLDYRSRKAAVEEAGRVMTDLDGTVGKDQIDGALHHIAATGEIDLAALPQGVTEEMVSKVQAGYVAQAEHALSQVGASVALLSDFLDPEQQAAARQATIGGDHDRLRDLGILAKRNLARLPDTDPDRFREMTAMLPPAEAKAIRYDENRRSWVITHPTRGEMSFGAAVNLGIVRF